MMNLPNTISRRHCCCFNSRNNGLQKTKQNELMGPSPETNPWLNLLVQHGFAQLSRLGRYVICLSQPDIYRATLNHF